MGCIAEDVMFLEWNWFIFSEKKTVHFIGSDLTSPWIFVAETDERFDVRATEDCQLFCRLD
jgi:hypothetical protein